MLQRVASLLFAVLIVPASLFATTMSLEGATVGELAAWTSTVSGRSIVVPDSMAFKVWLRSPDATPKNALSLLKQTAAANGWYMVDQGGVISFRQKTEIDIASVPVQPLQALPDQQALAVMIIYPIINRAPADLVNVLQSVAPGIKAIPGPSNSIAVNALPERQEQIKSLLLALDTPKARYVIDAVVLEESADTAEQSGSSLFVNGNDGSVSSKFAPVLENGVIGSFTGLHDFSALLAFISSSTRFKILSTPYVLVDDGDKGFLHVGDNVPILTGQTTAENGQIINTFSRQDVGLILSVGVRQIGDRIALDILQEASSVTSNVQDQVITSQRRITTKATVSPGEVIDLGGLKTSTDRHVTSGVPYLSKIPLLGVLFRSDNIVNESRTLRILIRVMPSVVVVQG